MFHEALGRCCGVPAWNSGLRIAGSVCNSLSGLEIHCRGHVAETCRTFVIIHGSGLEWKPGAVWQAPRQRPGERPCSRGRPVGGWGSPRLGQAGAQPAAPPIGPGACCRNFGRTCADARWRTRQVPRARATALPVPVLGSTRGWSVAPRGPRHLRGRAPRGSPGTDGASARSWPAGRAGGLRGPRGRGPCRARAGGLRRDPGRPPGAWESREGRRFRAAGPRPAPGPPPAPPERAGGRAASPLRAPRCFGGRGPGALTWCACPGR